MTTFEPQGEVGKLNTFTGIKCYPQCLSLCEGDSTCVVSTFNNVTQICDLYSRYIDMVVKITANLDIYIRGKSAQMAHLEKSFQGCLEGPVCIFFF